MSNLSDDRHSELIELLVAMQETLDTLATKVNSLEEKIVTIEQSQQRPVPEPNEDMFGEMLFADPIRHDAKSDSQQGPPGTTMKASLARIEIKLQTIEGLVGEIPNIQTELKETAKKTQVETEHANLNTRLANIEKATTNTQQGSGVLKDINHKADQLMEMNKEHKIRDLAIYQNTIIRENNKTVSDHGSGRRQWLINLTTGDFVSQGLQFEEKINSANKESLQAALRDLGCTVGSQNYDHYDCKSFLLAYMRTGALPS